MSHFPISRQNSGYEAGRDDALAMRPSRASRLKAHYRQGYEEGYYYHKTFEVATIVLNQTRPCEFLVETNERLGPEWEKNGFSVEILHGDRYSVVTPEPRRFAPSCRPTAFNHVRAAVRRAWESNPPFVRALIVQLYSFYPEERSVAKKLLLDHFEETNHPFFCYLKVAHNYPDAWPIYPLTWMQDFSHYGVLGGLGNFYHWWRPTVNAYVRLCDGQERPTIRPIEFRRPCSRCYWRKPIP